MMVLNSPVRGPRSSGRLGRSAAWRRRRRRRARGAGGSGPRRAPRPPPRGLGRASTSCTWRPSSGSRTTASSSGRRTRASSARRHHGVPSGRRSHVHSASSSEVDAGRRFFQADPYGFEVVNYALLAITFLLVYSYSCLRIFCFRTTPTRSVFATMQSLAWEQCSDEGACLVTVHDVSPSQPAVAGCFSHCEHLRL